MTETADGLGRALVAEFIGTFALIFIGAGAAIALGVNHDPPVAFAHGLTILVFVAAFGDISGGHFNPDYYQIPVNAPKCPYMSYHRDGKMRVDGNLGGTTSFNPNSAGLYDNQPDFAEPPLPIEGEAAHYNHYADDDHWEQPGNLFRLMTPAQQQVLFENTARAMGDARLHIKERHVANCLRADEVYGAGVARALGLKIEDIVPQQQQLATK